MYDSPQPDGSRPGRPLMCDRPHDRLHDRAVAAVVGVRAAVAEPAHPGVDDVGTELANVLLGEAPTLHHARREVLGHDAALGDQPLGELAPFADRAC